ncbi:unnamed protein product, partial [Staurois parvus]
GHFNKRRGREKGSNSLFTHAGINPLACWRSFHFALGECRTHDLCLDSADWPLADQMQSPKKKKTL